VCVPGKISLQNISVELLNDHHREYVEGFQSYEKELMAFLKEDALRNQKGPDSNRDPKHFYKRLGFDELKERKKGTRPMYYDVVYAFEEFKAST